MSIVTSQAYAVKPSAARGAKRAGIENFEIVEIDGKFHFTYDDGKSNADKDSDLVVVQNEQVSTGVALPKDDFEMSVTELAAQQVGGVDITEEDLAALNESKAPATVAAVNVAKDVATGGAVVTGTPMVGGPVTTPLADAPVKPVKLGYKEIARTSPATSTISNPLDRVWAILNSQTFPSRKAAVAHLVSQGININTARTQYQHWKASGDGVRPVKVKTAPVIND